MCLENTPWNTLVFTVYTADKVCKDVNMQLVDGKAETHPVLVDLDAS